MKCFFLFENIEREREWKQRIFMMSTSSTKAINKEHEAKLNIDAHKS